MTQDKNIDKDENDKLKVLPNKKYIFAEGLISIIPALGEDTEVGEITVPN